MTSTFPYRSHYRILGKIGQGQFGQVYFAIRRHTGDLVALKNLGQGFPTNRFLREFSYLISLRHPNIVACQAIEHHTKGRYLVMDYCEGGTLRNLMDASGKLSLDVRLQLIIDILAGLEHAHQQKIVHCDIKPENILLSLTEQGWIAKITDFGIAKLIQENTNYQQGSGYTGSPAYMAPERFYGKYSCSCDIYSVGILLYELMVGKRPFSGLPSDLMLAHLNERIVMPETVPEWLQKIIIKALEKLPQRRFSSAKEMLEAIRESQKNVTHLSNITLSLLDSSPIPLTANDYSQVLCDHPITHLAANSQNIYVGIDDQITCFNCHDFSLKEELQQQWKVNLSQKIKTIELRNIHCFILTERVENFLKKYSLYRFTSKVIPSSPLTSQLLFSLKADQLVKAIDLDGKWFAITSIFDEKQLNAYFQIFKLPSLTPVHPPTICPVPSQLLPLNNRYGLALFPRNSQGNKRTFLYLFNRRGDFIKGFSVPLFLTYLTANSESSDEFFCIEEVEPYYGILVKLRPLKISRIALSFKPNFIVAQSWGYGLANKEGKLCILNRQGQHIGEFDFSITITAMTDFGEFGLLLGTYSDQEGRLLTLDLQSIIESDN